MSPEPTPLQNRALEPLPLGTIEARGWLHRQLEIQRDGITGSLDETWPDLADNAWLGGARDGWERGPYYVDGLVPLAALLDDPTLVSKSDRWVQGFLDAQQPNGWFVPPGEAGQTNGGDVWPRFIIMKLLRQQWEVTEDPAILSAMEAFVEYLLAHPDDWELRSWSAMRWGELVETLHWLYEQTGDRASLSLARLVLERGYDWTDHFNAFRFPSKQPLDVAGTDLQMPTHVVNNAMGIKAPALAYRQTGEPAHANAARTAIDVLDRFHGQATGLFTGDEHLSGKRPTQGTELCAVVEYLYSLEVLLSIHGDASVADRLERIAYNGLPATFTPDMTAHQYDQQANQVLCTVADRPWTNGPDANIFGQTPHFGCCQANFHQGWPKLVAHLWYRMPEGGLAVGAYGPSVVETSVSGTSVRIEESTNYPFEQTIRFAIEPATPVPFALGLRIPNWATGATITHPDGTIQLEEPGAYHSLDREWAPGDHVELSLETPLRLERRFQGSVSLHYGPLVFAYPIEAKKQRLSGSPPRADWEFYPTEPWNYGLVADLEPLEAPVSVQDPSDTPFSPEKPPLKLSVEGERVPAWGLEGSSAGELPMSPVASTGERRSLDLVPYGCTNLRITEFPLIED